MMGAIERVRIILPSGEVLVNDYAFSQIVELTQVLSKEQEDAFWKRTSSVVTPEDSHFLPAGSDIWYVGLV